MLVTGRTVVRRCVECLAVALIVSPVPMAGQALKARILQTNAAGDGVAVIDVATDRVMAQITGIEAPNGVAVSKDGKRIFITCEGDHTLVAVDGKTLKEIKRIALEGKPNGAGYTDGKVYVAIDTTPGGLDVIDANALTKIKHIPLDGVNMHYAVATQDGKFVVATSNGTEQIVMVIDEKTDQKLWSVKLDERVRVPAFFNNPDGSTRWMFVNIAGLSGFVVVDWDTHKVIKRVETPWAGSKALLVESAQRRGIGGANGHDTPSHGVAVTPDNKSVWVNSRNDNCVYGYSLPDLKLLGFVPVGYDPMWISFSPDSKKLYEANNGSGTASVIDISTMTEVLQVHTGNGPSRNDLVMLP